MWIAPFTTSLLGYQEMLVLPRRVAPYQDVLIVLRRCAPRIAPLTLRGISLCALHKGQFNLRCELRKARFTTARRAWYNSSSKLQRTSLLKLGSHY